MSKLCFDYGHGGSDPGATYKGRCEKDDVLALGKEVVSEIRRHGVIVDEIRNTDKTVSLSERSSFENKGQYDYFISFHRNAFKPEKANGVETFIYTSGSETAKALANEVQKSLIGIGFYNRGVKRANYHVLRETKSPAILIEVGFIDSSKDNKIFDSKRKEIVKAIAKAILFKLGIKYKEESVSNYSDKLYRVMAGSFSNRKNAEKRVRELKSKGVESTIMIYKR